METQFQIGDKVEHVITGKVGKVYETTDSCVSVEFEKGALWFNLDGRELSGNKYPSIRLIERPKRMVKKEAKVWADLSGLEALAHADTVGTFFASENRQVSRIPVTLTWEEEG